MANISKFHFENVANVKCCDVAHPWTGSCIVGCLIFGGEVLKRLGLYFFAPIYLIQLCLKGRNVSETYLKQQLHAYLHSCLFGGLFGGTFLLSSCLFRKVLGRYTPLTITFLPGILCGLSILLEHSSRRNIVTTTFLNMTLECIIRWLELHRGLKRTPAVETAVFMLLSGSLMYLLRKNSKINSTSNLWFFKPLPLRKQMKFEIQDPNHNKIAQHYPICPHTGSCWKQILKNFGKFFGIGYGLQLVRTLLPQNKQHSTRTSFLNKKMLLFALFLGGYVGIYKSVSCLLNHFRGQDSEYHAIAAGCVAGIAYYLQPNITLLLTALTTILQILSSERISHSPLAGSLVFALCNGILCHTMVVEHHVTPKYFTSLLSLATKGRTEFMQRAVLQLLRQQVV